MTSATPLRATSSSPSSAAEVFSLDEQTCCVVHLSHQATGVVHKVVLDPAKIRGDLTRISEWTGDEARGWQVIGTVAVLAVLGRATLSEYVKTVTVTRFVERVDAE